MFDVIDNSLYYYSKDILHKLTQDKDEIIGNDFQVKQIYQGFIIYISPSNELMLFDVFHNREFKY